MSSAIELIAAEMCHEVNRACYRAFGDDSRISWDEASAQHRIAVVMKVMKHFAAFDKGEELDPKAAHDAWIQQKRDDGWRYGGTEDAEAKTHPLLIPYEMLPDQHKVKDFLFAAVCRVVYRQYGSILRMASGANASNASADRALPESAPEATV